MSAAQAIASSRFLTAMGPMIKDEQKMNTVLSYIISLRADNAPCQFSEQEIVAFADKAEQEYVNFFESPASRSPLSGSGRCFFIW